MELNNKQGSGNLKIGRLVFQLVVIIVVALTATHFVSEAALPKMAEKSLAEGEGGRYWNEEQTRQTSQIAQNTTAKSLKGAEDMKVKNILRPKVNAKSYLVANITSGQILAEKNSGEMLPVASLSKLMTAVVANETIAYDEEIRISQNAINTYGFAGGLEVEERLPLGTLYYPLLLESSNDAATAIAEHRGFNYFVNLMNRKALALDMDTTRFADPSGLSDKNMASTRDMFRLAQYIYNKKHFIFDITTQPQKTVTADNSDALRNFTNNNPIQGEVDFLGGKNGYTDEARHTLLSLFSVEIAGQETPVVIIVLGSEDNVADTKKLLSWLKQAT